MGNLPRFLESADLRLLLFGGKGGVGKTTCAAAAGVHLAQRSPERRFLLVSVDPAHSLADCLAGSQPPPNLEVLELDAQQGLAEFRRKQGNTLKEIARRGTFLDEEDIARFVDLSLPGLDELIAFLRISDLLMAGSYQTIVVDTAPSGHTLRLLAMPDMMRSWLDALDSLLAKHRYMKRLFRGSYKADDADRFLTDLSQSTNRTQKLLGSPQACFVPVFLAEQLSLEETAGLLEQLSRLGARVGPLLCNRLQPADGCRSCQRIAADQQRVLRTHRKLLEGREIWQLPLLAAEVRGVDALAQLWRWASLRQHRAAAAADHGSPREHVQPQLHEPAPAPAATMRMLLFAGKGGVGKTTLACAAALRLSSGPQRRKVMLISTDPAHSIGHCLEISVGPQPVEVRPGLCALAPDAAAEWRDWQERYRDELHALLDESMPSMDLTFDREVMERLLALCPPGLDEIMALTRVTELLADEPETLLIIDTAPTGHLLRLLEMPELLDGWLKAFFAVLLKYRNILRMPKLSDHLIALSKRLKVLRLLLHDQARAGLYAVAIPTRLSQAETEDLLAACQRMSLTALRLLVNQCTVQSSCELCTARHAAEAEVIAAMRSMASASGVSIIMRADPPIGVDALAALGAQLFQSPSTQQEVDDAPALK